MNKCTTHGYAKEDCPFCKARALSWERNDAEWEALCDEIQGRVYYLRLDEEADPQYGCILFDRKRHETMHFHPVPAPEDFMHPTRKELTRALEVAEMNLSIAQETMSQTIRMLLLEVKNDT